MAQCNSSGSAAHLMQKDQPVHRPPDGAVLVSDNNVAGDASRGLALCSVALQGAYEVLHHCGGYRIQACCRLIIHDHLQGATRRLRIGNLLYHDNNVADAVSVMLRTAMLLCKKCLSSSPEATGSGTANGSLRGPSCPAQQQREAGCLQLCDGQVGVSGSLLTPPTAFTTAQHYNPHSSGSPWSPDRTPGRCRARGYSMTCKACDFTCLACRLLLLKFSMRPTSEEDFRQGKLLLRTGAVAEITELASLLTGNTDSQTPATEARGVSPAQHHHARCL